MSIRLNFFWFVQINNIRPIKLDILFSNELTWRIGKGWLVLLCTNRCYWFFSVAAGSCSPVSFSNYFPGKLNKKNLTSTVTVWMYDNNITVKIVKRVWIHEYNNNYNNMFRAKGKLQALWTGPGLCSGRRWKILFIL